MISVIIPTYKRNDNLIRAIESVMNQKGNFELIVVDDNDSDSTYRKKNIELLEKYLKCDNFKFIMHDKNKNGAAARNTGIKNSIGEYITFLDDDDEFCPGRIEEIEKQVKIKDFDLLSTGFIFKKNGAEIGKYMPNLEKKNNQEIIYDLLKQISFFGTGSNLVCKKDKVDLINGFDESFIRHQDIEFCIRLLGVTSNIIILPKYLVIKNIDDQANVPTFSKMISVKEHFFEKFNYIIDKMPEEEKYLMYKRNYYELLGNAYVRNDKQNLKDCKNYLKEKGYYSKKMDFIIYIKYIIKKSSILVKIWRTLKK